MKAPILDLPCKENKHIPDGIILTLGKRLSGGQKTLAASTSGLLCPGPWMGHTTAGLNFPSCPWS